MNFTVLPKVAIALPLVALLALPGCGGGSNPTSSLTGGTTGGGTTTIVSLTGSASPAETWATQDPRRMAILARIDSVIGSTVYGESDHPNAPSFAWPSSCSGVQCTFDGSQLGLDTITNDKGDIGVDARSPDVILTKNGITTIRGTDIEEDTDWHSASSGYGAWMQHSGFHIGKVTFIGTGTEPLRMSARGAFAGGDLTGSRPIGSATWNGLMVGTPARGSDKGDFLQGDAGLTYQLSDQTMDAAFTNIVNIDDLRAHSTPSVTFSDVTVSTNGTFSTGTTGNRISGGIYGTGHAETAGVFEKSGIVGAFGATK